MKPPAFITEALWLQHRDPIAFLENQKNSPHRIWRSAWLLRGGMIAGLFILLSIAAVFSEGRWGKMVGYAVLSLMILQILSGLSIMITHQAQFWLLYVYSPPALLAALLCGLTPLSRIWLIIAWGIGLPFLVGALISDTGTLWVHKQLGEINHERERQRTGGVIAALPALIFWRQVRLARLSPAILTIPIVLWLFNPEQEALLCGLTISSVLIGCLHLDATALSWIQGSPPVKFNPQQGQWRTTYIGRSALFIPLKRMRRLIASSASFSEASAIIPVLLREGCLGPSIRRSVRELSPDLVQSLVLHLSLREGGAAAIEYLKPAFPQSLHKMADCYGALATEAAKPPDLQRWIAVLTNHCAGGTGITAGCDIDLNKIRDALVSHQHTDAIDTAITELQSFIQSLYNPTPQIMAGDDEPSVQLKTLPLSWPVALQFHLKRHRRRLLSS